jgi:hypothetical protein
MATNEQVLSHLAEVRASVIYAVNKNLVLN